MPCGRLSLNAGRIDARDCCCFSTIGKSRLCDEREIRVDKEKGESHQPARRRSIAEWVEMARKVREARQRCEERHMNPGYFRCMTNGLPSLTVQNPSSTNSGNT